MDHGFKRDLTNVTANHRINSSEDIIVLNRGFDRKTCQWEGTDGIAKFQDIKEVASLSVSFFWPFWGAYHVFALDQKNYNYALVSGPSYDYLWILARQPKLDSKIKNLLLKKARFSGFGVENLIEVDHTKLNCKKKN